MYTREAILESAKKHFPFPTPNPGQMDAIVEAAFTILNKTHKHIIIEAPTGIGKSIIAVVTHRVIEELKNERFRTTIITTTKGLQDQYANTDSAVFDLRGKTNYPCTYDVGPYNSALCRVKVRSGVCKPKSSCDYVIARESWCEKADLRLTNHSFQIEAGASICMLDDNVADLVIIDECHEVDTNIIEHTTVDIEIDEYQILNSLNKKPLLIMLADYIDLFEGNVVGNPFVPTSKQVEQMAALHAAITDTVETFVRRMEYADKTGQNSMAEAIESLSTISDMTEIFSGSKKENNKWIVNKYEPGKSLSLKPVFASSVANYALFRKAEFFLHMSATICGFDTYADILGLDENEVNVISIDNPIPLRNRKIYYWPKVKVSGNIDYDAITKVVDTIIQSHQKDSGIIHTVSFQLAQEIWKRSKNSKRMLVSGDYKEITNYLKKGGIVMSPSIEKGFDAKGDLSRFQIIAKIPFGYLGDPLTKLNAEVNSQWYARKTILRLIQACGRSVRGVDDYADTYIIDTNFRMLLDRNYDLFPQWWLDALEI